MSGFLKNRKLVTAILVTTLLTVTLAVGAVALSRSGVNLFPIKTSSSEAGLSEAGSPEGPVSVSDEGDQNIPPEGEDDLPPEDWETQPDGEDPQQEPGEELEPLEESTQFFNRPAEMRAVYITPGVDYLTDGRQSSEAVKADIDKALADAKELTMNSVIFDLGYGDKTIWLQSDLPTVDTDFDVFQYATDQARAQGFYIYAIYSVFQQREGDSITTPATVDATLLETLVERSKKFASSYDLDGVILDDYYHPTTPESYAQYMASGGGIGYENYLRLLPRSAFTTIADTLHAEARHLQVGMMTEAVWANKSYNDEGSVTGASYTTLYTGNADNKSYLEEGYVDFVAVKALTATTDQNVPFKSVVGWWGNVASQCDLPMYVVHAADKACTSEPGWTEYDQLTRQLIELGKTAGYGGSAFNSLSHLLADPKNSTTTVVKFFADDINPKHILTELAVTEPKQTTYSTFEQSVTFKGASDPNTEVTINGTRISTDANGYFTVNNELRPGLNKFTIVHKGKTVVYNITRQVQVLKDISPMGNITVDGGMRVTITANAYKDAKVYATVGGQTIQLQKTEMGGDEYERDTSYVRFEGYYTAPAAGTAVQEIGNIVVYGESMGFKENKQGAYIRVNKKVAIGDGVPVRVVADQAETFPTNQLDDLSNPAYFPLPQGANDYVIGDEIIYKDGSKTFSYYILASNLRVYSKDIQAVNESNAVDNNSINGMTVSANQRYTDVIFHTQQQVSYTARYDGNKFSVGFHYTSGHPDNMSLDQNPLFSSATWSGSTVSLSLSKAGRFLGYRAFYDSDGSLVLRFNNPPATSGWDLSGVKIVVDPGHGYGDPGASGFLPAYPESVINQMVAECLTDELRSRGANVVMLQTANAPKMVLETRVLNTRQLDPHLFISIHCNSHQSNFSATGTEVYYFNPYSKSFAAYSSAAISSALGTGNRGAKFGHYYVTRDTQYPGVLAELGFLSNEREYKKLISTDYQEEIASGIADAVSQYFNSLGGYVSTGTETVGRTASQVSVEEVTVDETLELQVGEAQTLQPQVHPAEARDRGVKFSSSNAAVATVDGNGNVFGVKAGTATITVTTNDGGHTAQCQVVVGGSGSSATPPTASEDPPDQSQGSDIPVEDATLEPTELELTAGETFQLTYELVPENASKKFIRWESDNPEVAKVDQNGRITAVSEGDALIMLVGDDDWIYADCAVYVWDE